MRSPVQRGSTVVAHVDGATVRGTVHSVGRTMVCLELASIDDSDGAPVEVDGYYLIPQATPMQVLPAEPRRARGRA